MTSNRRSYTQSISSLVNAALLAVLLMLAFNNVFAQTPLADRPVYSSEVTGNVALALSVEWPTGITSSYKSAPNYQQNDTYLGYFDSEKCYAYIEENSSVNADLFSTGVDSSGNVLASGSNDPHWSLVSDPGGIKNKQRNKLDNASGSYNTTTAGHIGWDAGSVPDGQYAYRSSLFYLPASINPNNISLSFELMPDDRLVDILINGVSKPYSLDKTPTWNIPAIVTMPSGTFSTLANELTIVIENTSGPTGLRVDKVEFANGTSGDYGKYFKPVALASNHGCTNSTSGRWSGNFLNFTLTQVIDPFRQALTGGYRDVDESNKTILQKAYAFTSSQWADFIDVSKERTLNSVSEIRNATPFDNWSFLKLRIKNLGTKFYITGSSAQNIDAPSSVQDGIGIGNNPDANQVYTFEGRVEACVTGFLESNCHAYPSGGYKPTGLIQEHAEKLRFSAFGYLFDSTYARDGGVMRARMSLISPTGDHPEWDANSGIFFTNPHPADASASGVSNSGVINYLNKFGYQAQDYKELDPVSELYYAIGRYFRNKGNVPEYSTLTGDAATQTAQKDGFPVITNWGDPIKNTCDLNYIIGVGDTETHVDANLPGSTIRTGNEPAMPSLVSNDYGSLFDTATHFTDVYTSTKRVGDLEGINNLQNARTAGRPDNSYFIAGLAYDLHTRDMRPDLSGKQTVSTYWLDVLEKGFIPKNQYWLASKYGGFTVDEDYEPYGSPLITPPNSTWDVDNDGDPDHYYRADDPAKIKQGLGKAFGNILSVVDRVSAGFALSNPNVLVGDKSFATKYSSQFWSGKVVGNNLTFDANGNPVETLVWDTDTTLDTQASGTGWDSQRNIVTSNCLAGVYGQKLCVGVPFRLGSLSTASAAYLDAISVYTGVSQEVLNYLRGDRSMEDKYRKRSHVLGDVVHSRIAPVGKPNAPYSDSSNPGYSTFKSTYQNRPTVVYVGANDGMLHAFDGDSGIERFAYVPNALFKGHDGDAQSNGLAALADPGYEHRFYVDASPSFYDVNFGSGSNDWHTLLMGGLGKGGRSYYALDVTNPGGITSETTASSKVLWEFSHNDLGFTFGRPISVKVDGKWVVIFTSGYNNQDGKGYFFVVDPKTGTLINKISTGVGSTSNDAGLAHLTAYIADGKDFTADAVYAGDLLGNLWRLDLAGITSPGYAKTPQLMTTLKSPNGDPQPITASPIVELDQTTKERYVFVGTGRLLDETDLPVTQVNSIYAIKDGDQASFYTSGNLPNPVSGFPFNARSVMVDHTGNSGPVSQDSNKPMGYFIDMPAGFYINKPMASSAGVFAAFANKIIGDTCDRNSLFRGYVLNYASGESLITNPNNGITTPYFEGVGQASSVAIYKRPNSSGMSVNFTHEGDVGNTSLQISNITSEFNILNWKLVPIE